MKYKDLNILMGRNLRKMRLERNMTQDQLAERLGLNNSCVVTKWEAGRKGIGKTLLLKLCKALNVKPSQFFVDEKTAYITSSRERDIVCMFREAEKMGVVETIEQFCMFIVGQTRKKDCSLNKRKSTDAESPCSRRRGGGTLRESPA
jgi:transcriptional regulator with XRE-family HTH domain